MNSNWTLRFPRSSREAYGHQIGFDDGHKRSDLIVLLLMVFALGFIVGLTVG